MTNLTEQDILTVGASYWLRQRADGSGPNISAISRDSGLSPSLVKQAVEALKTKHSDWLADYKDKVEQDAQRVLVGDAFTRIRAKINNFAGRLLDKTEENYFKLHDACMQAALAGKKQSDDEFQSLKIKQYERRACLGILRTAVQMAQELETAASPKQAVNNIGQQTVSFGLSDEEKGQLKTALAVHNGGANRIDPAHNGK